MHDRRASRVARFLGLAPAAASAPAEGLGIGGILDTSTGSSDADATPRHVRAAAERNKVRVKIGESAHPRYQRFTVTHNQHTIATLRMKLQPVFRCSSLSTLDTGSGRKIPAICHGPAYHAVFTP